MNNKKICEICGTDKTYQRSNRKTPDWTKTETGFMCKSCYSRDYASRTYVPHPKTPLSGPCVECKSETTCLERSGYLKWYRGPNGTICKKCFNRKNDKILKPGLCVRCGVAYTKHGWNKTEKGTICQTCYRSNYTKLERKGNCSICKTTSCNGWETHEPYGRICKSCSNKLRVRKIKIDIISYYSKGTMKCANCGYDKNINAFHLDHIYGNGNISRKKLGQGGWGYYRKLQQAGYPNGYQILCANCNCIKQIEIDPTGVERKKYF
jgi:hypothetical protein